MRTIVRTVLVLSFLVFSSAAVRAEGWEMPNLNPFAGKSQPSGSSTSRTWMPGWKKSQSSGPSVWKRVQDAPASVASGTKKAMNTINPFKNASTTQKRPLTGSNLDKPQQGKSWLPGWSGGDSQADKKSPATVSDWIAGPRPE